MNAQRRSSIQSGSSGCPQTPSLHDPKDYVEMAPLLGQFQSSAPSHCSHQLPRRSAARTQQCSCFRLRRWLSAGSRAPPAGNLYSVSPPAPAKTLVVQLLSQSRHEYQPELPAANIRLPEQTYSCARYLAHVTTSDSARGTFAGKRSIVALYFQQLPSARARGDEPAIDVP